MKDFFEDCLVRVLQRCDIIFSDLKKSLWEITERLNFVKSEVYFIHNKWVREVRDVWQCQELLEQSLFILFTYFSWNVHKFSIHIVHDGCWINLSGRELIHWNTTFVDPGKGRGSETVIVTTSPTIFKEPTDLNDYTIGSTIDRVTNFVICDHTWHVLLKT